jgi:hypothetical protein
MISTVSGDAAHVGMGRAIFCNDRGIDVFAGVNGRKCERAGCQYGEGQAKDQFVGFHDVYSRTR